MNVPLDDEVLVEGIARAVERALNTDALAERVADAVMARMELLEPEAAAALLGVTARTLADRAKDWGLDKSVAFGATNPRYFLSQIIARARAKALKGRAVPDLAMVKGRAA